ncbi:hypothetical protein MLD63_14605 [Paracoccus sp. TK19116]|uniref:Tetratricopeptide repeat protein n=1 Tax=Paracoccus albicereus TaxID=2922394 RepID=A0ABT1MTX8_9RHOB|nr:hypothetical protein [Paracoccus albicereus]
MTSANHVPVYAQDLPDTGTDGADPAAKTAAPDTGGEPSRMDQLFAELAQPEGEGWRIAESDILREWSRSGSAAMDLLYKRGEDALDGGDAATAIGHLTALADHAPDFASGYHMRAVAYATEGDYGPALADLARALQLEPRHFPALTQLGFLLEDMDQPERALDAYRQSLAIHPHQQDVLDAVERLEQAETGTNI